jgi:hypothetical protein
VSEMKPLGLGRGHTGQYSRPRRWRRDAGADIASPYINTRRKRSPRTQKKNYEEMHFFEDTNA